VKTDLVWNATESTNSFHGYARREGRLIRKTAVVQGSSSRSSDRLVNQNQVSDSGSEDTRSPARNGASLRQSLIVSCYN
jgi:hypothetical protein